jgi:predicted metal-binding membrane protein
MKNTRLVSVAKGRGAWSDSVLSICCCCWLLMQLLECFAVGNLCWFELSLLFALERRMDWQTLNTYLYGGMVEYLPVQGGVAMCLGVWRGMKKGEGWMGW